MAILGDALRQAFMPKREYDSLRDEDKAWLRLQRPLVAAFAAALWLAVFVATVVGLKIVFPGSDGRRPFCGELRSSQQLPLMSVKGESDRVLGAFYLTDQQTVDYYWMVVFIPSMIVFLLSAVYLAAGIVVAYSAPTRHGCLKVVENNYCASKRGEKQSNRAVLLEDWPAAQTSKMEYSFLISFCVVWKVNSKRSFYPIQFSGGVRCLSILNVIFATIYGLLALFLGPSLLTLGSSCSMPLFWCYEITSWGLVVLYGGTAYFLKRKAAVILDESDFYGRNVGLEMLETSPLQDLPDMERRVTQGFKAWMGSSLLSSDDDEEDEPDSFLEASHTAPRQRL